MKYFIIDASPDMSGARALAEQIKTEIICMSNSAVFRQVRLSEMDLPFCTGCGKCLKTSHDLCPHSDIISDIIRQIDWCDGVILLTSAFGMQPAALTKNLTDHLSFLSHRPRFFSKKALVIASGAAKGTKRTAKYLSDTLKSFGFNKCFMLPENSPGMNGPAGKYKTYIHCEKTAKKFHNEVSLKKVHSPSWVQVMNYNLQRGKYRIYKKETEPETYNCRYWTEPYRAKKAYDPSVPLPFYKAVFGSIFCGLGKKTADRLAGAYKK